MTTRPLYPAFHPVFVPTATPPTLLRLPPSRLPTLAPVRRPTCTSKMTPPPGPRQRHTPLPPPPGLPVLSAASLSTLSLSFTSRPSDMSRASTFVDVLDAQDAMMAPPPYRLRTKKVKWNAMKAYAASGAEVLSWLLQHKLVSDEAAAMELATALVRAGALVPTFKVESADEVFRGGGGYVHRGLTCLEERGLNGGVVYPGKARGMEEVLREVGKAFGRVVHVAVSVDGQYVDYGVVRGSHGWREILVLLAELGNCGDREFAVVGDDVKKACLYNLYNVLVFHAKLVLGHPTDLVKRGKFFNEAAYVMAGKKLTSVELEHEVLRRRMEESDARLGWRLEKKDPRMHFILNCGAQSCPPLMVLDAERTEEMLQAATRRFIEENCEVDGRGGKVLLSRLWKWFRYDFTPGSDSDDELMKWIAERASEGKRREIEGLLQKDYKIKFDVYNWADNGDGGARPDIRFMAIYDLSFSKTA